MNVQSVTNFEVASVTIDSRMAGTGLCNCVSVYIT